MIEHGSRAVGPGRAVGVVAVGPGRAVAIGQAHELAGDGDGPGSSCGPPGCRCGRSPPGSVLSRFINGKRSITLDMADRLSEVLRLRITRK
jgi:hypothetical protein